MSSSPSSPALLSERGRYATRLKPSVSSEGQTTLGRPLRLSSPSKADERKKLLKAALQGELNDQFQKSIMEGAKPESDNLKASDIKKSREQSTEHAMSSALIAQLLNCLSISKRHQSPPNSPSKSGSQRKST